MSPEFYVIRHKATGRLLPARMSQTRTCSTLWEPTNMMLRVPVDPAPRLFVSADSARRCIAAWAAGVWGYKTVSFGSNPLDDESRFGPDTPPVPRWKDQLEVVRVALFEVHEMRGAK